MTKKRPDSLTGASDDGNRRGITDPAGRGERRSYLPNETTSMERRRRLIEQQGHRQLAVVHAREHHDESAHGVEEGLQQTMMQNPWLDSQRFDGVDPNLNPEPPLNSEARREYDNEKRDQEMEKQLRLGLLPQPSTAPKPQGP